MTLELFNTADVIDIMENYIARVRPPEHIRDQLDIGYKIEKQSVILFEIRPHFENPVKKIESAYAKTTYVKRRRSWGIYWMRSNLNGAFMSLSPRLKN